jgi:predicted type IV restriction endonuclease
MTVSVLTLPTGACQQKTTSCTTRNSPVPADACGILLCREAAMFSDKLKALAKRLPDLVPHLATEEATKTALVLPFIGAMGYDVFDPTEVVPELVADVGTKRGEKVDYAIRRNGEIIMLIECKSVGVKLDIEGASQLYRYFSVTKARIAVLTDGVRYHFYSDLDEPNKLDRRPFLMLDLENLRDDLLAEAAKMAKEMFSLDDMLSSANALKHQREIRAALEAQLENPDEEFVRLFHSRVATGRFTQAAKDQFTPLVRKAFTQLVSDRVSERLRIALASSDPGAVANLATPLASTATSPAVETPVSVAGPSSEIVTTDNELEGFRVVRAIVCGVVPPERVVYRDAKTYFSVLIDNNNRKPICRLWFNASQWYLGLLDAEKEETRHPIASITDLYRFADELRAMASRYSGASPEPATRE